MRIKIKSAIIISMVILSGLIINCNFDLRATDSENGSNGIMDIGPKRLIGKNLNWSQIEVISEPIAGQNNNIGMSGGSKIAIEDDKIYVVWADTTDYNGAGGDQDIFYRYFDGSSWSEIQVISEPVIDQNKNTGTSSALDIAVENGKIYVVWQDLNNTNGAGIMDTDIFFRCNLTGSRWEDIQVISEPIYGQNFNIRESQWPVIAVENGKIFVVWQDFNNTNGAGFEVDIFYRYNFTGANWEDIQVISEPVPGQNFNIGASIEPAIAVENGNIYAVWKDNNNTNGVGADYDIFFRCNLTGTNWEDIQVISEPVVGTDINCRVSEVPAIAVENGKIYVVWHDENNTNGAGIDMDIFYRCNLTGMNWEATQVISEPVFGMNISTDMSFSPAIATDNNNIYVVWRDKNNLNGAGTDWDIFYRCNLTGYSWEDIEIISEPFTGMNYNIGVSNWPDIAVNFSKNHIVWYDSNDTNGAGIDYDIFYRYTSILSLYSPKVTPISGNTSTIFNFTITYRHIENKPPIGITVNISGTNYSMLEVDPVDTNYLNGKDYFFNIKNLDIGVHNYKFWALDGINIIYTSHFYKPIVYNTPPNIITEDNLTAIEDIYYEVQYEYEDIDRENVAQVGTWNFSTNASWLTLNSSTGVLNGTPSNDDVGSYWVNISINDTIDMDYTNFTLTVIDINDNPMINTSNIEITYEDALYEVDYNATDVDSLIENQIWSLSTNASSWFDIDSATGIISGTPTNDDVGDYWVNVSVEDGDDGFAYTNYTLIVLNVNDRPEIITEDELIANVNILYKVDYNATDIDSPLSQLIWLLDTNATWLNIDSSTGVLTGTPSNSDLGWFNLNVSVDDGDGGEDWHEFILSVTTEGFENEPPEITTIDQVSITAEEPYNIIYEATDDRTPVDSLIWSYDSNASWLGFSKPTRLLSGIPTLSQVGWYWVNVTVNDGEGKLDFHNFTLTVYSVANQPPNITTEDDVNAIVGEEYSVDYEATDDRTPVDKLRWFLKSNASWLNINENTGLIYGIPELEHVGSYLINISVFDGENGWDWHVFNLRVINEPVDENNKPTLSDPTMSPIEGDTEIEFTFTVNYYDADNDAPTFVQVVIDNRSYSMTLMTGDPSNGTYAYSTKLSEGTHIYYFTASDGYETVETDEFTTPNINKTSGKVSQQESSWLWLIVVIIVIIIVMIILFLIIRRKKKAQEEEPLEEEQLPEEVPSEQPQITEIPLEQPPTPEIPSDQPQAPEVIPQVTEPQVEPTSQPTLMPKVKEPIINATEENNEEE